MHKRQSAVRGCPFTTKATRLPGAANRLVLLPLVLAGLALAPVARAESPAPGGGYPGNNTAVGDNALAGFSGTPPAPTYNTALGNNALFSLTTSGNNNTATGAYALYSETTGLDNTATGTNALYDDTEGSDNTAVGYGALYGNDNGSGNTAVGVNALTSSTGDYNTAVGLGALAGGGSENTAEGYYALLRNTGTGNTAQGYLALYTNTSGGSNTANGFGAMLRNTTAKNGTASGYYALYGNTTGNNNTAQGYKALSDNTTGSLNIAMGYLAGVNLTTGSNNIDIGSEGTAGEGATIRLGTSGTHTKTFIAGISGVTMTGASVVINSSGQLGVTTSSERYKENIQPMEQASEALYALQPVTFRYKSELDVEHTPQFGLVAEQVAKVNPDLVLRDAQGQIYTVRYEAVNAMLLNEFLKEHGKVQEQATTIAQLKTSAGMDEKTIARLGSIVAQQQQALAQVQSSVAILSAQLKEQAALVERIGAPAQARPTETVLAVNNP